MSKVQIRASRTPVAASEYKAPHSNETLVGSKGEINASSKKDLLMQGYRFLQASANGELVANAVAQEAQSFKARNRELISAAFNDSEAHRILGEKIAESLYITGNRTGYLRRLLAYNELQQGEIPRFPVRLKNAVSVISTSPTDIETQITRDKWLTPPEFDIVTRLFIPQKDINQSRDDVLAEKFVEAQEATMVAEDRLLINAANVSVGVDNELTILSSSMTPYTFMQVVNKVSRWGLKTPYAVLASDLMTDIIGNQEFQVAIDPVARHELLLTGEIGVLYGCSIISDAYRHPEHKVLNAGEFYVFSDAVNTGAYSDRGGLVSAPLGIENEKKVGRGWVLYESFAMALANTRAVAKGIRH